jgi:hypothetical protein
MTVEALDLGSTPCLVSITDVMVTVDLAECPFLAKAEVTVPLVPLKGAQELGRHIGRCIPVPEGVKGRCKYQGAIGIMAVGTEIGEIRIGGNITGACKSVNAAIIRIDEFNKAVHVCGDTVAYETGTVHVCAIVGMCVICREFRYYGTPAALFAAVTAGTASA